MESNEPNLFDVIKEELVRLGLPESDVESIKDPQKKNIFFTFANMSNLNKDKGRAISSPRHLNFESSGFSYHSSHTPSKTENKFRRNGPKSPFSSKNRVERKSGRKFRHPPQSGKVFGIELEQCPLFSSFLEDGTRVHVPEFLIDVSNFIKQHIGIEGIFRKAGSLQRQNDVKKLLDFGKSLPMSIHPIDAACLLKQYLRSLPDPLISVHVHSLMSRCLQLNLGDKYEALILCTLFLPRVNQDVIIYLFEFLSKISDASARNLMDSHNLAIVLAPNLLPPIYSSSKKGVLMAEDQLLTSTINIIETLIEASTLMSQMMKRIREVAQNREKSQSAENIAAPPPSDSRKKKRRSASVQRLLDGIRRVVQGGNLSVAPQAPPTPVASSFENEGCPLLDHTCIGAIVSHDPEGSLTSPGVGCKRKSDECLNLEKPCSSFDHVPEHPNKKPRFESNSKQMGMPALFKYKNLKNAKSAILMPEDSAEKVKRSYSLRTRHSLEKKDAPNSPSASQRIKAVHENLDSGTPYKVLFSKTEKRNEAQTLESSCGKRTPSRRRSYNVPSSTGKYSNSKDKISSPIIFRLRRKSLVRSNNPDGNSSTLGFRGQPDGAESDIRDTFSNFRIATLRPLDGRRKSMSSLDNSLETLEQQYDEIKYEVKKIESEIKGDNLDNEFAANVSENQSCSQLIHTAYERMKFETRDLDCSPSEVLSKRLVKELRIRNRRSGEQKAIRSPSERRIGTIRRRSKELEQNLAKNCASEGMKENENGKLLPKATPVIKSPLLRSPLASLKRGKPNNVHSGLPIIVKTPLVTNKVDSPVGTPKRTVSISKRKKDSLYSNSEICDGSRTRSTSDLNGSFIESYSGPVTRRSSVLSTLSNPLPSLDLSDNSLNISSKSYPGFDSESMLCNVGEEEYELDESESDKPFTPSNYSFNKRCNTILESSNDLTSSMEWISATSYLQNIQNDDSGMDLSLLMQQEANGGRPSIAALKKQKKVTSNVQLFNGLYLPSTPQSCLRGSMRLQCISMSERRKSKMHGYLEQKTNTPHNIRSDHLKVPNNSKPLNKRSPKKNVKIAVVSPLKENTQVFKPDLDYTPKILHRTAISNFKRNNLKIASEISPLPPRPFKPPNMTQTPQTSRKPRLDTPPKLPPRISSLAYVKIEIPESPLQYR